MTSLYSLLNSEAKRWWFHAQLRERGKYEEARQRERASIKSTLKHLRDTLNYKSGYLSLGRGGYTLHPTANCSVQGYGCDHMLEVAKKAGILVLDTRTIPDHLISETITIPMPKDPCDKPPYTWLSYAPLGYCLLMYQALGATIHEPQ